MLLGDSLPLLLGFLGRIIISLLEGVLTNSLVSLGVQVLKTISLNVVVNVLLELALEALLIVIGQGLHVLSNVTTEDVLAEGVGVELLALHVVSGESLFRVGNQDATVGGALHGTEYTGTSGGSGKTNIKEGLEGSSLAVIGLRSLGEGELTIGLLDTDEVAVKAELLENTTGDQKTGGIGGSPVGEAVLNAVSLQLVGIGSDQNLVTRDLGGDDLHDDVLVGESDDKTVLGRIVLVLGLGDETLAGIVVGLAFSSTPVLGLVPAAMTVSDHRRETQLIAISRKQNILTCSTNCSSPAYGKAVEHHPRVSNLRFRHARPPSEATCDDSQSRATRHFCHEIEVSIHGYLRDRPNLPL